MANTQLTVTDIDFDNILNNFRNYLKSQDKFRDYNFDGSAITELLKLLSYNTFYNAFYTNHIANEMYLDSATERSSVVSRAKSLGYIPASAISSRIYVDLESHINKVTGETPPTGNSFVSLLGYSTFTTSINSNSYNFITTDLNSLYYDSEGTDYWVYKKNNVKIVEGKPLRYSFTVQNDYDSYLIPNDNVDLTSIIVRVYPDGTNYTYTTYTQVDSMVDGIDGTSTVYWIYEGTDGKHYLQFGNDSIGKKLSIGNVIYIEYIVNSGSSGNGAQVLDIGNYYYSNTSITERNALTITPSNYSILTLSSITDSFVENNMVRGVTSNNTAYVYSFDINTATLKLYSSNTVFLFNESIQEETLVGANTIIGATGIITSTRTEVSMSSGGSDLETIDNIKLNAPKLYASQNRLITSADYSSIIKHNYPYVKSVSCWGGEEESPQQLGHIYVSVKPKSRETLDVWEKDYILDNIIEDKKVISMNVHIIDPDYVYISLNVGVKYDADISSNVTEESMTLAVVNAILNLNSTTYDNYKTNFYYSAFSNIIDNTNEFILGSDTEILMLKHFTPLLNVPYTANNTATLKFYNQIYPDVDKLQSYSTTFTCNVSSTTKTGCSFAASNVSSTILTVANSTAVVISNAGTIDYANGIVYVSNVNIISTDEIDSSNNSIIKMYANPVYVDLVSDKNCILKIDTNIPISLTRVRNKK
jgi:hypothetical protein